MREERDDGYAMCIYATCISLALINLFNASAIYPLFVTASLFGEVYLTSKFVFNIRKAYEVRG